MATPTQHFSPKPALVGLSSYMPSTHSGQQFGLNSSVPASEMDDLGQDALRKSFLEGTISLDTERKLLNSAELRRSLLGSPVSDEMRRVVVSGQISSQLRSRMINEMHFSGPNQLVPTPSHAPVNQNVKLAEEPPRSSFSLPVSAAPELIGSPGTPYDTARAISKISTSTSVASNSPTSESAESNDRAPLAKRAFTAKRTNRPERPPPLNSQASHMLPALTTNTSKLKSEGALGSVTAPEPARISSDIAITQSAQRNDLPSGQPSSKKTISPPLRTTPFSPATLPPGSLKVSHLANIKPPGEQAGSDRRSNETTSTDSDESSLKRKRDATPPSGQNRIIRLKVPSWTPNQAPLSSLDLHRSGDYSAGASLKTSDASSSGASARKLTPTGQAKERGLSHTSISRPASPSKDLDVPPAKRTIVSLNGVSGNTEDKVSSRTLAPRSDTASDGLEDTADNSIPEDDLSNSPPYESSDGEDYEIDDLDRTDEDEDEIDWNDPSSTEQIERVESDVGAAGSTMHEDDWNYKIWTFPSGETAHTGGALLSPTYQPYHHAQFPEFQWVCPIRTCRSLFTRLWGLGGHFNRAHRGWLVNDNGDGTLSLVRKQEGSGQLSATVISKNPLDPNEPPMPEPSIPVHKLAKLMNTATSSEAVRNETRSAETSGEGLVRSSNLSRLKDQEPHVVGQAMPSTYTVSTTHVHLGKEQRALWHYIQQRLVHTPLSPIPYRGHVPELLQLRRVRNVEFNPQAPFRYSEARPQDIAAMILQVVGIKAEQPCQRCVIGKGPFLGCYILPPDAPLGLRQSVLACANCFYKCNQTYCDHKRWALEKYPELSGVQVPQQKHIQSSAQSTPRRSAALEKQPERRSDRIVIKESTMTASQASGSVRQGERVAEDKRDLSVSKSSAPNAKERRQPARESFINQVDTFSIGQTSTVNPAQMLELETWEVAPGRIRDEDSGAIDNFAFSNAYLAQNQAVKISRDIAFQVITIKPGTVHSWEASTDKLRLCSVASGKLQVKIHGQEFLMGPNGMFRIKPRVDCTAMNKLYIDATVHVTVMPGDLCK
ncbi:hypothetical protein F5B20DRAFT_433501 [Whalleya microplaca]|nr:hypothetical protein F5B20DRAFT_433501 [Whalleya microplaca]